MVGCRRSSVLRRGREPVGRSDASVGAVQTWCRAVSWGLALVACGPRIAVLDALGSSSSDTGTATSGTSGQEQPEESTSSSSAGDLPDAGVEDSSSGEGSSGEGSIDCLVPTSHATIQDAIDDAACPSVFVGAGMYIGNLWIDRDLTLEALGDVTIDGAGRGSVITIVGADVTIVGTTITGGRAEQGGGIVTEGSLHLQRTVVAGNVAEGAFATGGGIHVVGGALRIDQSRIVDNVAMGENAGGGGIAMATGAIAITDSLVGGNAAIAGARDGTFGSAHGGGVYVQAISGSATPVVITRSTVSSNLVTAPGFVYGGGVSLMLDSEVDAEAWIVTSTISGNVATGSGGAHGGGIFAYAGTTFSGASTRVSIDGSTIAYNAGQIGSALHLRSFVETEDTIGLVASTMIVPDPDRLDADPCAFYFVDVASGGYNLDASTPGCDLTDPTQTDRTGVDPMLLPLADNGGPTPTHALAPGSAAIDGGDPSGCTDPAGETITVDQRGEPRLVGTACDVGAVEM
jgi:hypothetical protein